ncbi:IS110 family transposase [Dehalococcoidia bacterium]|nr:IS110 family transposase [Dehalococcoidia bacterium]MCL0064166.1 IS110 family transposase [Dehalococcoidia bacterium]MCL0092792.1 IS110 family transposase [Dehalococcoidia bacterium]
MPTTKNNQISFKGQHFYIGIDVHKKRWVVTIRHNGLSLKTFSTDPSPEGITQHLEKHYPGGIYHLAYEVGFSGFWICRRFHELGFDCIVVNPADIPTTHKEKDQKRDPVDSHKLARELEKGDIQCVFIPPEQDQNLRSLCRLYGRQVQNSTRVKNRIKGLLHFNGVVLPDHTSYWSGNFIAYLKALPLDNGPARDYLLSCLEELKQVRQSMASTLQKLRHYARQCECAPIIRNLMTVSGIGFKSAIILYTEIIDINRFRIFDQLKSYAGLVPSTHSSGETDNSRGLTHRRNGYLRWVLIEGAWVAIRQDPALLQAFNKLITRMTKQDAIIRIAVKLLSRIRYVWKNDCPYVVGVIE